MRHNGKNEWRISEHGRDDAQRLAHERKSRYFYDVFKGDEWVLRGTANHLEVAIRACMLWTCRRNCDGDGAFIFFRGQSIMRFGTMAESDGHKPNVWVCA